MTDKVSNLNASYRLWVNADRTVLVRFWMGGHVEVCTRPEEGAIWGPPVALTEERT
jgi:hypothetical protein